MKRALPFLLVLLLTLPWAEAEEGVRYGPVPAELAAVVADERDDALVRMAMTSIERGTGDTDTARSLLGLLGDAGLKAAAERLARGELAPTTRMDLVAVVAAAEHPEADTLLGRAADESRPALRMLAADGLGRGRSARAVPILARLARDPVPGVRIAALRSLFAIESPQAVAARIDVPREREYELLARRLSWHHRCEDVGPALRDLAVDAYLRARSVPVRMAAAHYLTLPALDAPREVLELILREMGQGPYIAGAVRVGRGLPRTGYDPGHERRIAIDAVFNLLARADVDTASRTRLIDLAVAWVARPIPMDPYRRDPIPEHVLRRRLPDLGAEILEPVVRRLERGGFAEPRQGVILLRELGADVALPPLRRFLEPRASRPPFESRAEAEQRRYLRGAAAGAIQELGRIGDETLARALLAGDEAKTLKIDVLHALRDEDAPWVVPLLTEVTRGDEPELRSHAITILEKRPEPEARALLVDDLFERVERPHDRLAPLVRRGGDDAYTVLKRALQDDRPALRIAALSQFHRRRAPRLMNERSRTLLARYEPSSALRLDIQQYVYALLSVDPVKAVSWVREQWENMPSIGIRMTTLRILGETHGKKAREAAIDLALEKVAGDVPRTLLLTAAAVFMGPRDDTEQYGYTWTYRKEEVGAFWRRLLDSDDAQKQRDAIHAYTHALAPDAHVRLLELLKKALAGEALPEASTSPEGEQAFARDVINALQFQPWPKVEAAIIDAALDPYHELTTRVRAAHVLMGRLSDEGRTRLIRWLDYTPPPEPKPDGKRAPGRLAALDLQLFLAAAVGENADATVAGLLYEALKRELLSYYTPERLMVLLRGGPDAVAGEVQVLNRVVPLARGVSRTKHVPSILGLLDIVFDLRFALYARVCAEGQGEFARSAGAGAAARTPSKLKYLLHNDQTPYWGMPTVLHDILYE
nr:HEAT repeat domain-containing protein [Planctomycetota bacterium]